MGLLSYPQLRSGHKMRDIDLAASWYISFGSDNDVSLMGTMLYYIDVDWTMLRAMLIGATGFLGECHTRDNIRRQTLLDLLG